MEVKQRGSHIATKKADAEGPVSVPLPDHRELRAATLMSIIRQSAAPR